MEAQKLGIDAGGSLIKLAIEEHGRLHYKKYPVNQLDEVMGWLKATAAHPEIGLTGGKADLVRTDFFPGGQVLPEFQTVCEGAVYLLKQSSLIPGDKFLVVNIGTGTSWFLINGNKYERILGSGLGGGTLMGLGQLLADNHEFSELVTLARDGDKGTVDILVRDIYFPQTPPIDGSLTASSFAKIQPDAESTPAGRIASLVNMIAENTVLLSMQAGAIHQIQDVVYIGSTLSGNQPLKEGLEYYSKMVGLNPVFLSDGEYSGAVGAWLAL
ncbi:type II pantothenate kinase [Bacillus sp. T33-2]|uniref:type II pantothenate kinase n=1 Tax=Bacillus sp. T33-2 TaxID=2054168 RepID=UPI000C78251E|nr:type II pantothenate kinase [Bacillus sp. T33-2]PLR94120.1 type II pantothenate kinase [Bacillus sp. T33-2]